VTTITEVIIYFLEDINSYGYIILHSFQMITFNIINTTANAVKGGVM